MATGYINTFIIVAPDCPAAAGTAPDKPASIAGLEYALLTAAPYTLTGDDLIFAVHCRHKGVDAGGAELEALRAEFFAKPRPCLRASMLPKRYGWGVHYDGAGRIALYGVETADYRQFSARTDLKIVAAMRNRRA